MCLNRALLIKVQDGYSTEVVIHRMGKEVKSKSSDWKLIKVTVQSFLSWKNVENW